MTPSIEVQPLEAIGVHFPNGTSSGGEPWQNSLFGKTGQNGGVWWNWKTPFADSVRVTIEHRPTGLPAKDLRYLVVRGVRDATQFAVGDAIVPLSLRPRLRLQRTHATLAPYLYAFVEIFASNRSGMLLLVSKETHRVR